MRFVFIHAERALYPVLVLCSVLEVSRSGYHAWIDRARSARTMADARLAVEIGVAHKRSRKTYGSPRVHRELRAGGSRRPEADRAADARGAASRHRGSGVSAVRPTRTTRIRSRPTSSVASST